MSNDIWKIFPLCLSRMKNRFPSKSYRGWHLVIGLLVFVSTTLILGEIAEDIINGEPLTIADAQLNTWLHAHRSPQLTTTFLVITALGSTLPASCIAVVVGLYLLW